MVSGVQEDRGGQEGTMMMTTMMTMRHDNGFRYTRRGQRWPRRNDDDRYDDDNDV